MIIKEGKYENNEVLLNTLEVHLPKTTLLIIEGYGAFAMCGALDVNIYNSDKLKDRKVVCMKSTGVKTIDQLLNSKIKEISLAGNEKGLYIGMSVYEAFKKLSKEK